MHIFMSDRRVWLRIRDIASIALTVVVATASLRAEDGSQGWLRYAPPLPTDIEASYHAMPAAVVNLDSSVVSASGGNELIRGLRSMLGRTLRTETGLPDENAWVLGTTAELHAAFPNDGAPRLRPEGFSLSILTAHGRTYWLIEGADPRGILYGAFHVLSGIARGESFTAMQG